MKPKDEQHPIETLGTNTDWRKLPRNRPDKDEKHLAYSVLIANGISREKAATMLGYSPKTARSIDRTLKEKSLKLELLSEQRIKKAHRVIDKCLAGKAFGDIETVKDSTALRAAEMILDRSDPKVQDAPSTTYRTFTVVELDLIKPKYSGKPTPLYVWDQIRPDPISPPDPADVVVDVTPDVKPRTDGES